MGGLSCYPGPTVESRGKLEIQGWLDYAYRRVGNSTVRFRRTEHLRRRVSKQYAMKNRKVIHFLI